MTTLAQACAALTAAKEAEAAATAARIDCEQAVLAHVSQRAEGSITAHAEGWKATVTYNVNRTVDQAAVASMLSDAKYAWAVQRLFPVKFGLDTSEMRFFQSNEPEYYAQLAQAITAKPGKPSVRVERVAAEREAA
jgi:hypothetical protein